MANRFVRSLKFAARTLGAAARVGNAVENGDAPRRQDLDRLGIDPGAFRSIGR